MMCFDVVNSTFPLLIPIPIPQIIYVYYSSTSPIIIIVAYVYIQVFLRVVLLFGSCVWSILPVLFDHYTQRLYYCPELYYMLLSQTSVALSCYYLYIDMNSSVQKVFGKYKAYDNSFNISCVSR